MGIIVKTGTEAVIEQMVIATIPIYTVKNPNPRTGRCDCNLTKDYKLRRRDMMRMEIASVINRHKDKTKEL